MMNAHHPDLPALYRTHLDQLQARCAELLPLHGFDGLAIASGVEKFAFLDDKAYPFQANPHFLHWVPLPQHPGCWLLIRPGRPPLLIYPQAEDYWHAPPAPPSGYWVEALEIQVVRSLEAAAAALQAAAPARLAVIGEADAAVPGGPVAHNPEGVLAALHHARAYKTDYELQLMRAASRRAAVGHLAARAAFEAGGAEFDIHLAYLAASGQSERELPYGNIVGLGAHGAVLHWQFQDRLAPAQPTTLLIDAGAQCAGYASDITRTWLHPHAPQGSARDDFAALLAGMEQLELALVDQVRAGTDYAAIHLDAHQRIATLLLDVGLLQGLSAEAAVTQGATRPFFPHGIGHLLGLQVHDIAGLQIDAAGTRRERPAGHPYLRLTRPLAPGMVVTIEPGLYFIPLLLRELQASPLTAHVNWARVEALKPFGGIRIEDDVVCRAEGAPENLTRDAFRALSG
ncbi:Xaa-Pro dipeptidase [Inhella gelatinilytica]|uniref:Xaa-Pro dipeptidase n=1 Tax=Inhella gelatinilytica TaxID=2795030 RepID=A0A931IUI9_9BURK|nr:Xaa-Pro dipeptidase [Inhella gelatinilytica]MBH9552207.1 Xaa-Pro dipeptidase [Inhella gelatinilytica]